MEVPSLTIFVEQAFMDVVCILDSRMAGCEPIPKLTFNLHWCLFCGPFLQSCESALHSHLVSLKRVYALHTIALNWLHINFLNLQIQVFIASLSGHPARMRNNLEKYQLSLGIIWKKKKQLHHESLVAAVYMRLRNASVSLRMLDWIHERTQRCRHVERI